MTLRVIDALQLPEVLDGSTWFELPVALFGPRKTRHGLPTMTVGIDPTRRSMHYCDRFYEPRAMCPTHLGKEAALTLKQLLDECSLVVAPKMSEAASKELPDLPPSQDKTWSCPWCSATNTSPTACRGCGSNSGVPREESSP